MAGSWHWYDIDEGIDRLRPHCWGQSQVTDCSHLVVVCAKQEMDAAYIDKFIGLTAALRGAPEEALKGYRDIIAGSVLGDGPIGVRILVAARTLAERVRARHGQRVVSSEPVGEGPAGPVR